MSDRERLSWQPGKQPVLPSERRASAHPAYPDEGAAHPAAYPDPEQPDAYENGDTSSWAEDPTKGPYPNSAHPQYPDEGPAHPAAAGKKEMPTSVGGDQVTNEDLGVSKAAAAQLRIAVEKKAAKCIRVAQDLLAPWTEDADAIEDQALDLMDLPDEALDSTLSRLALLKNAEDEKPEEPEEKEEPKKEAKGKKSEDEEPAEEPEEDEESKKEAALLRKLLAEEGMEPAEEDEEKTEKTACEDRMSALESQLSSLKAMIEQRGQEAPAPVDEDEAMLEAMLAEEEEAPAEESEDEAMLKALLAEEEGEKAPAEDEDAKIDAMLKGMLAEDEKPAKAEAPAKAQEAPAEDSDQVGVDLSTVDDPMGLMDDAEMGEGEEALLANLFASDRLAGKKSDDDEEEDEESEEKDEESEESEEPEEKAEEPEEKAEEPEKKASQKPQSKKASQGPSRLGTVSRQDASDISELEKLWPSAPDVSKVFGS